MRNGRNFRFQNSGYIASVSQKRRFLPYKGKTERFKWTCDSHSFFQ